ncbi:P-loop containing nucleoside triphosphate hydrolase protein [Phakopsora pachyrhizi]|nr:P-loop containing nucleoside triphosphate hydrolase protein [Phakopsora pachyrhizi]
MALDRKQNKEKKLAHNNRNKPRKIKRHSEEEEIKELLSRCSSIDLTKPLNLFTDLPISSLTLKGLKASEFETMTPIQALALPRALKGMDVLGAARTGSGKTLAFLIPVLEILYRQKWGPNDSLGALVISPTRELAVQIFEVLRSIGRFHAFSAGLVIGGKDLAQERDRLSRMNILVATPGRLQQHLEQTTGFDSDNLQLLVLDEADRILDMGFSNCINAIISCLPTTRQTLLFSATQTKSVKDLARLSLRGDPEYVVAREAGIDRDITTPKELVQSYMATPLESKLDYLWGFLKTHLKTKMIVFMSSCKQVRFVYEAFRHLRPGIPLLHLHGKQKQVKRMEIYQKFSSSSQMCLFATDVAARGLDFPSVDWVIQLDCPEDVDTYIHRVGRTARYQNGGKALIFLLPSEEEGMLSQWKDKGIIVNKVKPNESKKTSIQNKLQAQMFKFPEIKFLGQRAFISYVRSIYLQRNESIFNLSKLDLNAFAESLGLPGAPKVRFIGCGNGGFAGGSGESAKAKKNAPRDVESLKKQVIDDEIIESKRAALGEKKCKDNDKPSLVDDSDSSVDDEDSDCSESTRIGKQEDETFHVEKKTLKTKYERMFQRKNQDILSNHYAKVVDRSEGDKPDDSNTSDVGDDNDFLQVKRVDHELDLEEAALPDSAYLSKRKLKMATSKKALAKMTASGKKIIFDDEGEAHDAYKILGEEEFKKSHDVSSEIKDFVLREREKVKDADKRDRLVEKSKKQEKKRKRKGHEDREVSFFRHLITSFYASDLYFNYNYIFFL